MKRTSLLAFVLLCLPLAAHADMKAGTRVPAPTAAGQALYSGSTAPFTWQPVTLPYSQNGAGQMAVGGSVDSGSRLSVSPSGAAENGLTVTMPSGATGYSIQCKTSTGSPFFSVGSNVVNGSGLAYQSVTIGGPPANSTASFYVYGGASLGGGVTLANGSVSASSYNGGLNNHFYTGGNNGYEFFLDSGNAAPVADGVLGLRAYSAAFTGDLIAAYNPNLTAKLFRVDSLGQVTLSGYSQSLRTVTANDTATLSDSVLLVNGAFNETLPTAGVPVGRVFTVKEIGAGGGGGLTNSVDGVNGYSLAANQYAQVIYGGASGYYKIGGN